MRKFISFFIKYPIWSNAIIIVILGFGLLSMFTMRHSFFPEMESNRLNIMVAYPGASPQEMEEGVTTKLEEALKTISGIEEITSTSAENFSTIYVECYTDEDIDEMLTKVKNAVDGVNGLPIASEQPLVVKNEAGRMSMASFISLSGPDDLDVLKEVGDKVERDFLNSSAISDLQKFGYPDKEIVVEIRESDLQRYNLSFNQVVLAINSNNLDFSGGTIKTDAEELFIRSMNRSADPKDIEDIVIFAQPDGNKVKIRDVANVSLDFSEVAVKSYVNSKRSVTYLVNKLPNDDLSKIAEFTEKYVNDFNINNEGFEMKIMFQFSDMLDDRIDLLGVNLFFGLLLVVFVLSLFLRIRLSLWVAFGIPFSFIGMFAFGAIYGMTINMISLFGMIMVIGILVDDGIVIAENIYDNYERGKTPMKAALDGTLEVMSSVFTSVITTIVAFGFLFFVEGRMAFMAEMAFAVVACLLLSLVEAFLILPAHLSHNWVLSDKSRKKNKGIRFRLEKGIDWLRDGYAYLLRGIIKRYRAWVFFPLIFILFTVFLQAKGYIGWTWFENPPFDSITLAAAFKPGETATQTEEFLWYAQEKIDSLGVLLEQELGEKVITYVSLTVGNASSLGEIGPHAGLIRVSTESSDNIDTRAIANRIKACISKDWQNRLEKFSVGGEEQFGKPISISITSEDAFVLTDCARWLTNELENIDGLNDVIDNSGIGNRELQISLKPKARLLGLTLNDVLGQIRQGFFGAEAQRLILGRDEIKVWVRYPKSGRSSLSNIDNVRIKTNTGQSFPFYELAEYTIKRGKVEINHLDGRQEIEISADVTDMTKVGEYSSQIYAEIVPQIAEKFPEVQVGMRGQSEEGMESVYWFMIAFIAAIVMMMIILSLNFKSFYQARLILMVIPIGFYGAIMGHGIEGFNFSTLGLFGVIALAGVLVNDSVVMLDTYNRFLRQGMDVKKAAYECGKQRFRPVILTTITTVAGLYPLILESSFQAQFLVPMAITIAYGVLFGTLILIFFFPALILFFADMKRSRWWLWRGGKYPPARIEVEPVTKIMKREQLMADFDVVNPRISQMEKTINIE
ncbi:MAG: efflux RND transporter permease subunit [Flavobacteriales bacterium]|nr:efflux RND transporter permease subunit [Flavobacteriales bacterium]